MKTYWYYSRDCIRLLYRRLTQNSRVFPDFLILGTPRSGTTSLTFYLSQHPDYVAPFMKEMGYTKTEFPHGIFNAEYYVNMHESLRKPAQTLLEGLYYSGRDAGYKKLFPKKTEMLGARDGYQKTTADCLVFGIYGPLTVGAQLPGKFKAIFMVRKPIDYLYSFFVHEQKNAWRNNVNRELTFDAFVKNPGALWNLSREEWTESLVSQGAAAFFPEADFHKDRPPLFVSLTAYSRYLQSWMNRLGPERVLVIHSEEFFAETQLVMNRVFSFLNMAPHKLEDVSAKNANAYSPEMLPETRAFVHDSVKPYNEELYELLGKNLGWDGG